MENEKKYVSLESLQVFLNNIKNTFMSYICETDVLPENVNNGDVYKLTSDISGNYELTLNGINYVYRNDEYSVYIEHTNEELYNVLNDIYTNGKDYEIIYNGNTYSWRITNITFNKQIPHGSIDFYTDDTDTVSAVFTNGNTITIVVDGSEGVSYSAGDVVLYHNNKWIKLFSAESTESITQSDMEVYVDTKLASLVDSALSPTSTNPVQNKVLNDEFNAISNAMGALEVAIDNKADSDHTHNVANLEYAVGDASLALTLADVIDDLHSKIEDKSDKTHTHYASTLIYDSENENTTLNDVINGLDSYIGSKADTNHSHTVSDISDINDLELITVDDIDAICATVVFIQNAEEVSF